MNTRVERADSKRREISRIISLVLTNFEQDIIRSRWYNQDEKPETFENIAKRYKISRERVRQVEVRAFQKLKDAIVLRNI